MQSVYKSIPQLECRGPQYDKCLMFDVRLAKENEKK